MRNSCAYILLRRQLPQHILNTVKLFITATCGKIVFSHHILQCARCSHGSKCARGITSGKFDSDQTVATHGYVDRPAESTFLLKQFPITVVCFHLP